MGHPGRSVETTGTRSEKPAHCPAGVPGPPPPRGRPLVRRQVVVPDAERLEGAPEALLGSLFVQGGVDVGDVEGVDGGGEGLDLALALLDRAGEGDAEAVEDAEG